MADLWQPRSFIRFIQLYSGLLGLPRDRTVWRTRWLFALTLLYYVAVAGPAPAQSSPVLLRDDFSATYDANHVLDPSKWSLYDSGFAYGRTQFGNPPAIASESGTTFARLSVSNYNYNNDPNFPFKGTEMFTAPFSLGIGKEMEARARVTNLPPGLVAAFWMYGSRGTFGQPDFRSDEIDIECLSKQPHNSLLLTNWNDWDPANPTYNDGIHHSSATGTAPGLDFTAWTVYKIRWLPDRTEWYANDVLVRSATAAHPDDPMTVRFNVWVPDNTWPEAYDGNLPITTNSSLEQKYNFDVDWVEVRNVVPALTMSVSPGTFSEADGPQAATGTVTRNSDATNALTVDLSSSDTTSATVQSQVTIPAGALFTTFPIAAADNFVVDGTRTSTITASAAGFTSGASTVTVNDNDVASVTVSPHTTLTTTEAGGTATFTVALTSQPTADVTIPLQSSNTAEGTVSPAAVTFTAANWNQPQTVTVTGVDDNVVDGDVSYTVVTGAPNSADPVYSAIAGSAIFDVPVINRDNDTAGVVTTPGSVPLATAEGGGTATFSVRLNSQPVAPVTVTLASSNGNEGIVSPTALTFTPANWNQPQTATVTGVDDAVVDGDQAYRVDLSVSSDDLIYKAVQPASVPLVNRDNDIPTLTATISAASFAERAGPSAAIATVRRNTSAVAPLVVNLNNSNPGAATVPTTVTIPAGQASADFPLGAIDNAIVNAAQPVTITASADGYVPSAVTATVTDDDVAKLTLSLDQSTFSETASFPAATGTVTRNSDLGADMTIGLSSTDPNTASVPAAVTIPAGQLSATFPVSAVNDNLAAGPRTAGITATVAGGPGIVDATGLQASAAVTVLDSVQPALTLTTSTNIFSETAGPGAATGTLTRNTPATAPLTVSLTSSPTANLVLSGTITIPAGQAATTFAINAVDDNIATGPQPVVLTATVSGFASGTATITVTDDDIPTLTLRLDLDRISEGSTTRAALTRNTPTAAPLMVQLSSSNAARLTVPVMVTIPAGAASVLFPVAAFNNTVADGPVRVTLRATSDGYGAGTTSLTVLDNEAGSQRTISGRITVPVVAVSGAVVRTPLPGATVTLRTGLVVRDIVVTDSTGAYRFTTLPAGTYSVTPALLNYSFVPVVRTVTLTTSSAINVNFDAVAQGQISGHITRHLSDGSSAPWSGITVTASYAQGVLRTRTDANGNYAFQHLPLATYAVVPAVPGTDFAPRQRVIALTPTALLVSGLDFQSDGTDTLAPTVQIATPRSGTYTAATAPTRASGTARDSGGAGLTTVTLALARFTTATATAPSAFYNWSAATFVTADNPAQAEHLAVGTSTWSVSGLPALSPGFYALRATAADAAGHSTRSAWLRFTIAAATRAATSPASPVRVSSTTVTDAGVELHFTGVLDAEGASDAAYYAVTVNGRAVVVETAGYNAVRHSVTLGLAADELQQGDTVVVTWEGLTDEQGRAVNGQAGLLAPGLR